MKPGAIADTMANFFDIEFRTFYNYNNKTQPAPHEHKVWVDRGHPGTQGQFQYYQPFILNARREAVEGLIVSTLDTPGQTGIGFRNHALPPSSEYGYIWREEMLWLEPETVCIDLNITLDYTIPSPYAAQYLDDYRSRIADRGGLANNPKDHLHLNLTGTQQTHDYLKEHGPELSLQISFWQSFLTPLRRTSTLARNILCTRYRVASSGLRIQIRSRSSIMVPQTSIWITGTLSFRVR